MVKWFRMTMLSEKIVVTAREFITDKNINDSPVFIEPMFQAKIKQFGWGLPIAAASIFCEVVWKMSIGRDRVSEWWELDRLFSPSPVATHANFRGCSNYKTGNLPELGALAVWRRGNTWQGHMSIVIDVSGDKQSFDVAEGRSLEGSSQSFLNAQEYVGKKCGLPFKNDKLNLLGFIYPLNREI